MVKLDGPLALPLTPLLCSSSPDATTESLHALQSQNISATDWQQCRAYQPQQEHKQQITATRGGHNIPTSNRGTAPQIATPSRGRSRYRECSVDAYRAIAACMSIVCAQHRNRMDEKEQVEDSAVRRRTANAVGMPSATKARSRGHKNRDRSSHERSRKRLSERSRRIVAEREVTLRRPPSSTSWKREPCCCSPDLAVKQKENE